MTLVEALRKFNRKERYWLIRNALGENSEKLDPKFRKSLDEALSIQVPEDAWWAMDYHLDWLVGALYLFSKGEGAACERQYNRNPELVKGTQEDVDLIIAFDKTLIFIEAKGDAGWDDQQVKSKFGRLQDIAGKKYFEGLKTYFIFMAPKNLLENQREEIDAIRPDGVFAGRKPRWLDLQIKDEHDQEKNSFKDFCRVGCCNENDDPYKAGEFFLVRNPNLMFELKLRATGPGAG
jgi:hypothetical protein